MKNRKIYVCMVLACLTAVSFVGCKKEKTADNTPMPVVIETTGEASTEAPNRPPFAANKAEFQEKIKTLITAKEYEMSESDTSVSYNIKFENRKEYKLDYRIHFNDGSFLSLPVSYQDMTDAGWTTELTPDAQISNKSQKKIAYLNSYGKEIRLWASNPNEAEEEKMISLSDSTYYSVEIINYKGVNSTDENGNNVVVYEKNNVPDFSVAGGVTQSASVEDVISIMGKPSNAVFYEDENQIRLFYNEEMEQWNGQLMIEFLADRNIIRKIEYKYTPYHVGTDQEKPAQPTDSAGLTVQD